MSTLEGVVGPSSPFVTGPRVRALLVSTGGVLFAFVAGAIFILIAGGEPAAGVPLDVQRLARLALRDRADADDAHAAADHRARAVAGLPRTRLQHRRRGAALHGRARRRDGAARGERQPLPHDRARDGRRHRRRRPLGGGRRALPRPLGRERGDLVAAHELHRALRLQLRDPQAAGRPGGREQPREQVDPGRRAPALPAAVLRPLRDLHRARAGADRRPTSGA